MIILGIETSCDETALALLEVRERSHKLDVEVIGSLVHSQAELHSAYGGVYPTLAKREHGKNLVPVLHKLLIASTEALETLAGRPAVEVSPEHFASTIESFRAELAPQNPELFESFAAADFLRKAPPIDRIAVTEGPGLEPALWTGINLARMLSTLWSIPLVPVNHMAGHVVGSLLPAEIANGAAYELAEPPLPALAFLISGGHTELVKVESGSSGRHSFHDLRYEIVGQTLDDAVGEAFDKAARLLGLPYPGGPHLSRLAQEARDAHIAPPVSLPRPMLQSGDLNFSFSGLKTAVLYATRKAADASGSLPDEYKKGLALEFETAVADTLEAKLRAGIEKTSAASVIIGGGVSANHVLRSRFQKIAADFGIPIFLPAPQVSGDNAIMIALAGAFASAKTPGSLRAQGTKKIGS
jgi:N6-L-threonylcarbamoyladenine synthase